MRLLDALTLLDMYVRGKLPEYAGSSLSENVRRVIDKSIARTRRRVRPLVPLPGQSELPMDGTRKASCPATMHQESRSPSDRHDASTLHPSNGAEA